MDNRHLKRCFTLSRKFKLKTTMRYHLTPVRMAIIRTQIMNVGKAVEKRESSYTVDGNVNWCSHCEKQYGVFSKN